MYVLENVFSGLRQPGSILVLDPSSFITAQNLAAAGGEAAAAAAAATPLTYPPTIPYPGIGKTF